MVRCGDYQNNHIHNLYMKFILGRKIAMTQYFDEEGRAHPATVIDAGPITVTQVKTVETDGYSAVQVGYGTRREKNVNKAQLGAWGEMGPFAAVTEFRDKSTDLEGYTVGDIILTADQFQAGDKVFVTGTSKGKGFQGVVKRHGFAGGRRSHGQKHSEREPGSIGSTGPQRVFKGTRMGGRMGSDRVTVQNLQVLAVDAEKNQMVIKGALPGRRGTLLEIVNKTQ
ncbi:MAG: large subunit ribosomal protein L3 [Planctomycetota bacterium]|jgi:large subunit ribosomal protein L3